MRSTPASLRNVLSLSAVIAVCGCGRGPETGSGVAPGDVPDERQAWAVDSETPLSRADDAVTLANFDSPLTVPEASTSATSVLTAVEPSSAVAPQAMTLADTGPSQEPTVQSPTPSDAAKDRPQLSDATPTDATIPSEILGPREIKLLVPQKSFSPEGPGGPLRVRYDDLDLLMVLNMDPVPLDAVSHFPDWLKALEGQQIRIRGFMYPPPRQEGITYFQLARDNEICCFGRDPKVYDLIAVELAKGTSTSYIPNRPFDVVGVFHIDPFIDGDKMYELYRLDDASIITR